jgi:serine/threonine-protein kinase HipA
MESLYSLAGVSDFGVSLDKEVLAASLVRFVTNPESELGEFVLRDVLDVALGNTDNHGRNTAVLKYEDGWIELSPVYDFAPMVLDPQGIARVCRWRNEEDAFPRWDKVASWLESLGLEHDATRRWLRELASSIGELPQLMTDENVPLTLIDILRARIERVARALGDVR